jgi:1-acyl-sn-glycerol-3-phosphate acyltransferase
MNPGWYSLCRNASRAIRLICIRQRASGTITAAPNIPLLLAVTHLSHLEPVILMAHLQRPIYWMARKEFFETWWGRLLLTRCGSFPVDRAGFALPAVRKSINLLRAGHDVGIFPEGGVTTGPDSVVRGGTIKQGVCTISIRTGVPVLPVIVLGSHHLNRVGPWLPFRRGRIWIGVGKPVPPLKAGSNRASRTLMTSQLQSEFVQTYRRMLSEMSLLDSHFP